MSPTLAVEGGPPVRATFLPYSKPVLTEADVAAVLDVLRSGWLTTGPTLRRFEEAFANATKAHYAVGVSSCTAALHISYGLLDLRPGDEIIVPAFTFAATAAAVVAAGGRPVIADVGDDLNLDVEDARNRVTRRSRGISAVHMGGLPCDLDGLEALGQDRGLALIQDCAHAVGAAYRGVPLGGRGFAACYSFHAVKQLAAGEGGALTTDNEAAAERAKVFRSHFQTTSAGARHGAAADYHYDIVGAGFNYRLPEVAAALALSQLERLPQDDARRQQLAARYEEAFGGRDDVELIPTPPEKKHGRHLFIIKLRLDALRVGRDDVFRALRAENVGVNVHYIPLHYHTYYRDHFGYRPGDIPRAEALYPRILSIPLFAAMTDGDADDVVAAAYKVLDYYRR